MTTSSVAIPFVSDGASALPRHRDASDRLALGVVTLAFLLSFLQYCLERNDVVRLVPVVLLVGGALLFLLLCPRDKRRMVLSAVGRPFTLALIAAVSVLPLVSSLYRPTLYPFEYGIAMIVTLLALRILLLGIGFEGLLLSFFYGTSVGMLIVVGLSVTELLASIGATRYAPLFFDSNRTGFFAVTAIPAQLWFVASRRRYSVLLITALCILVALAASSRGSIGALLIGSAVAAVLYAIRTLCFSSFGISRNQWIAILALLSILAVTAVVQQSAVANAGQYLWSKLDLDNHSRGLDSGFTGRTTGWTILLEALPKTSWLLGNGYRTTDEDFNFSVDNGYLAGIYELGLFSSLLILAKYAFFLYFLSAVYLSNRSASGTCLPALIFVFTVFFGNAFVHRVFFGFGDPASALALFAFVSTRQDVVQALHSPSTQSC